MEVQTNPRGEAMSSPKRKECTGEERVVQLEDLRTMLKEERLTFREKLKTEMRSGSNTVSEAHGGHGVEEHDFRVGDRG